MEFLQALFDWLRVAIGIAPNVQQRQPIRRFGQDDRVLLLLYDESCDDDFPGLAALWLCESSSSTRDCLLLCANLAQLREWLFRMKKHGKETLEQTQWRRALEVRARAAIREQENVLGTHLFIVASVQKSNVEGYRHLDCVGAWIVDLIGIHTYFPANKIAIAVTESVALKVLHIGDGTLNTWEEILFDYEQPWLYWIEEFARRLMNSPTHNVQPPRARRGYPGSRG